MIRLKRAYDRADPADGYRVLVDRLWPRGVSTQRAAIDLWAKDVAPSPALRDAFHHEGMGWEDFAAAYRAELAQNPALPTLARSLAGHEPVTLVYASRDEQHNHAVLLRDALSA